MNRYVRSYRLGYIEGIKDGYRDYHKNKEKSFKITNSGLTESKMYDIGYIYGYRKIIKYVFKL